MSEPIEQRVQRLEEKTNQQAGVIAEIHSLTKEVRDLATSVTQYMERSDHLRSANEKLERRFEKMEDRQDTVEKILAAQAPVIAAVSTIGNKIIWACICFALASGAAVTVLGYLLKTKTGA